LEILKLLAKGYNCQEAARQLDLPPAVVHAYVRDIYYKLHFNANAEKVFKSSGEFIFNPRSVQCEVTLGDFARAPAGKSSSRTRC
jgi:hypothetical protein